MMTALMIVLLTTPHVGPAPRDWTLIQNYAWPPPADYFPPPGVLMPVIPPVPRRVNPYTGTPPNLLEQFHRWGGYDRRPIFDRWGVCIRNCQQ